MPHDLWSITELLLISLFCSAFLFSLLYSGWMSVTATTHHWLWRLYAALIWGGLTITVTVLLNMSDEPEAPPSLALGIWPLLIGMLGTIAQSLIRLLQRHRRQRQGKLAL